MADPTAHPGGQYVSTACRHQLHDYCRHTCKYCDAPCACNCHQEAARG